MMCDFMFDVITLLYFVITQTKLMLFMPGNSGYLDICANLFVYLYYTYIVTSSLLPELMLYMAGNTGGIFFWGWSNT